MLDTGQKQAVIEEYRAHDQDTGSSEVQIALLTERISGLSGHLRSHKSGDTLRKLRLKSLAKSGDIKRLKNVIPPLEVGGDVESDTLVLGWGGTHGAILSATEQLQSEGVGVARAHLRHLNPMPSNLGDVLGRYRNIIVPEINTGQLRMLVRAKFLVDAKGVNIIQGRGFHVHELAEAIRVVLKEAEL